MLNQKRQSDGQNQPARIHVMGTLREDSQDRNQREEIQRRVA